MAGGPGDPVHHRLPLLGVVVVGVSGWVGVGVASHVGVGFPSYVGVGFAGHVGMGFAQVGDTEQGDDQQQAGNQDDPTGAGEQAVVFGCGIIGIAAAIMLKYLGLTDVMVCDRSDFRLGIAADLGFLTCNTARENLQAKAGAAFGSAYSIHGPMANIDIWIDAAGAASILDDFMARGTIGARFVLVAVNQAQRNLTLLELTYSSQSLVGSGGYRPEDVTDVMDIMRSGRWAIERIITDEYSIDQLDAAIRQAADTERAFNVIVHFDGEEGR